MLELLQQETAHANQNLSSGKVPLPLMLKQTVNEFITSPEGVGWLQHMEKLLYAMAKMGESMLEYQVIEYQRFNDVISDPMCPLYAWYLDTLRNTGFVVNIFERPTTAVIRSNWKTEEPGGKAVAAQMELYMLNGVKQLQQAWSAFANVPVRREGVRLVFDWSPLAKSVYKEMPDIH
jgi:hypothetical protein